MWTGSLNRVSCMITVSLLRETRCLLYPKARKHWRWQKSAVQAGLEKCCGGENDTVKFGSESLTMMAALLFAFKNTHTYAHTRMRWRQLSKSVVCQDVKSHTLLTPSHCVSFIPPTKESSTFDESVCYWIWMNNIHSQFLTVAQVVLNSVLTDLMYSFLISYK